MKPVESEGMNGGLYPWAKGGQILFYQGAKSHRLVQNYSGKINFVSLVPAAPSEGEDRFAIHTISTAKGPRIVELASGAEGTKLEFFDPATKKLETVVSTPETFIRHGSVLDEKSGVFVLRNGAVRVITDGKAKDAYQFPAQQEFAGVITTGHGLASIYSGGRTVVVNGMLGHYDGAVDSCAMLPDGKSIVAVGLGEAKVLQFGPVPAGGWPLPKIAKVPDRMVLGEKVDPKLIDSELGNASFVNITQASVSRKLEYYIFNRSSMPLKYVRARMTVWAPGLKPMTRVVSNYVAPYSLPTSNCLVPQQWSTTLVGNVPLPLDYWRRDLEHKVEILEARAYEKELNPADAASFTALLCRNDAASIAKAIDANPSLLQLRTQEGANPLQQMALSTDTAKAKLLIDKGLKPDVLDSKGQNALHYAAASNEAMVKLMLANGAKVVVAGNANPPIRIACLSGQKNPPIDLLISLGVDKRDLGYALLDSLQSERLDLAKRLVAKGAKLQTYDGEGRGPVGTALAYIGTDFATKVSKAFGQFREKSPNGRTLAHVAALSGRYKLAQWAVAQGYDPMEKDANGMTAFDLANQISHEGDKQLVIQALEGTKF